MLFIYFRAIREQVTIREGVTLQSAQHQKTVDPAPCVGARLPAPPASLLARAARRKPPEQRARWTRSTIGLIISRTSFWCVFAREADPAHFRRLLPLSCTSFIAFAPPCRCVGRQKPAKIQCSQYCPSLSHSIYTIRNSKWADQFRSDG